MLALILQRAAMPMPIGSSLPAKWTLFAGMTIRPAATSLRTSSGVKLSCSATNFISAVISPPRAACNWVSLINSFSRTLFRASI